MNIIDYPRECHPVLPYTPCRRIPDRIPVVTVETDEDGNEIIKHGYKDEDLTPPDFVLMNANDLTLQAQVDAGVQLSETRPIAPNTIDAVKDVMVAASSLMSNPQTFSPMIN